MPYYSLNTLLWEEGTIYFKGSKAVLWRRAVIFFPPLAQQRLVSQGLLFFVASRSHSEAPDSAELLWTRQYNILIQNFRLA